MHLQDRTGTRYARRLRTVASLTVLCAPLLVVAPTAASAAKVPTTASTSVAAAVEAAPAADTLPAAVNTVVPVRLLDTRASTAVPAGGTVRVSPLGKGDVPTAGVAAVVVNVTAVTPSSAGYLTVFPTGGQRPTTSNVNFAAKRTVANLVVARLGPDGTVTVYAGGARTHVLVDVQGWFATTSSFTSVAPARLVDSRSGLGGPAAPLGPRETRLLEVRGKAGVPVDGVASVVLNVTAVSPTEAGYLTVHPSGMPAPRASNVNFAAGDVVPNLVVAQLGADGTVSVLNGSGTTQLVVDVFGWLARDTAYTPVTPARLVDTRTGTGAPQAPVGPGGELVVGVVGRDGVPSSGVGAILVNVTAIAPSAPGHATVYPAGQPAPTASNINFPAGRTVPGLVVAKLGTDGRIVLRNGGTGRTHYVVDLSGWLPLGVNEIDPVTTVVAPAGSAVEVPNAQTATVTYPPGAALPAVGELVAATDTTDDVVYGRVTGVTGSAVALEQVTLSDVIPFAQFGLSLPSTETTAGARVYGSRVSGLRLGTSPALSIPRATVSCSSSASAGVSMDGTDVWARNFRVDADWGVRSMRRFVMAADVGYDVVATAGISAKADCAGSVPLLTLDLKPAYFSIGPVPVTVTQRIALNLSVKASTQGQVSVGYHMTRSVHVGYVYENGAGRGFREPNQGSSSFLRTMDAEARASVTLTASYSAAVYGVVGLTAAVKPTLRLTAYVADSPPIRAEYSLPVSLTAFVHLKLGPLSFDESKELASVELARGVIGTAGWSNGGPPAGPDGLTPEAPGGEDAPPVAPNGGDGGGIGGIGSGGIALSQGPAAPAGYRYAVRLSGFPAGQSVAVTCHDSLSPAGFYTFSLVIDGGGNAFTQSQCFSGDGPEHWVTVNGTSSNRVSWGPGGAAPPPVVPGATVTLAQGPSAPAGYRYAVTLAGFPANRPVTVTCHDSVDSGGFYTFTLATDGAGTAYAENQCYSGDGPEHWVVAGGVTSRRVVWGGDKTTATTPGATTQPAPSGASVRLGQGPAAPYGYRYAVTLSGFPAGTGVSVSCHDSVDPRGFFSFTVTTDGAGNASVQNQCYSGDGPDHWVIAGGLTSNRVGWGPGYVPGPGPGTGTTYAETVGGPTNTWTDFRSAGGTQGQTIAGQTTVQVACKVTGFRVADGNTWWYRIASSPWNGAFYASADAFYNNGSTSGSLSGTPFVDPAVPDCGGADPSPPPPTYPETTGGPTNTWTDYRSAGGSQGQTIPGQTTVQIACKVTGFRVANGNTWWYRIASSPWNGAYYASADAFYNNGATSGSLAGTPYVDSRVPDC